MLRACTIFVTLLSAVLLSMPAWGQGQDPDSADRQNSSDELSSVRPDDKGEPGRLDRTDDAERIDAGQPEETYPDPDAEFDRKVIRDFIDDVQTDKPSQKPSTAGLTSVSRTPISGIDWTGIFAPMPAVERRMTETPEPATSAVGSRDPHLGTSETLIFPWAARNLAHRTLYFEDMPLERYGQSCGDCVQPVKSGLRFLADAVTTPLQMLYECPCDLHYVLPLDRPGVCSYPLKQPIVPYVPK